MRPRCLGFCLAMGLAVPLDAQRVVMKRATPALVTQVAAEYLQPDGFVLVRHDSGRAEFGLNRGKIPQHNVFRGGRRGDSNLFWVVMEIHLQFKPKGDGVEVSVYEDVVVLEDDSGLVSRRRVTSHGELDNLRAFLMDLQRRVEERVTAPDSVKQENGYDGAGRPNKRLKLAAPTYCGSLLFVNPPIQRRSLGAPR